MNELFNRTQICDCTYGIDFQGNADILYLALSKVTNSDDIKNHHQHGVRLDPNTYKAKMACLTDGLISHHQIVGNRFRSTATQGVEF